MQASYLTRPTEFQYDRKWSVDDWILSVIPDFLELRNRFKMMYDQNPWFGWVMIICVEILLF